MTKFSHQPQAFGAPGVKPLWTHGNKDGVGTALFSASHVWFTLWNGIITEVYYPTIDRPQIRDLQYLISDGKNFFQEEKRDLNSKIERIGKYELGYRIFNHDPQGRYILIKEIISDPHFSCILQHTQLTGDASILSKLQLYVLCSPHLNIGGQGNNAHVVEVTGQRILVAQKNEVWLALGATIPFTHLSCGYVGKSDGWTDLSDNFQMDWQFAQALEGNVALTGKMALNAQNPFTLGLAFGNSLHNAISTLFQSLEMPFSQQKSTYQQQWEHKRKNLIPLDQKSGDQGNLYHSSFSLLLAHEDKSYPGAIIASLSIPWGQVRDDHTEGGYHLVWTRDMVSSAAGLMAAGDDQTARRALIYLATTQQENGGFAQNFWINGNPYRTGIQLDEVAFPILLAWKLHSQNLLLNFDIYPMVMKAAGFLVRHGPVTQQERWEETSGYSPSTLSSNISALICAGAFARDRGDVETAQFLEEYADFLESHLETWTVTTQGSLVSDIKRHYIRITPAHIDDPYPNENPNDGTLWIGNQPPGHQSQFPAKDIVDAGFLQLVRHGIRKPDDPIIVDSVKVIDAVLKIETLYGPCWHRYNHDGYGQRSNGQPYQGWGKGRAWPLLTGERGHYELALGNDVSPYIKAMEGFASNTGLLPEQIWDEPDRPEINMFLGRSTGSAMPLMWAHAEYIKLLRSTQDGQVFDWIPIVADRYLHNRKNQQKREIWKFNRQVQKIKPGYSLRIQAVAPFRLRWSQNNWQTVQDTQSNSTCLGIYYLDIPIKEDQQAPINFTFLWTDSHQWENKNYQVEIERI